MKELISKAFAAVVGGVFLGGISASANPIATTTYGGNTFNLYDAYGISWNDAEAAAISDGGFLAVLTTSAEIQGVYNGLINNGFFQSGVSSQDVEAWLGATPVVGGFSTTDPTNWKWVTGAIWTTDDSNNFGGGEPNGDSEGLAINRYGTYTFNDEGGHVGGYIVEIQGRQVPDGGSTLMFLGAALGSIGMIRRKLQK
jgi:VPDSG-CTERM motif